LTPGKRTGVARKMDQLGRVVLPAEVRREFGIRPGDLVEISVDAGVIVLSKVEDRCVFCAAEIGLVEFSGKLVCHDCVDGITTVRG
jgi:AbrB family transcriptional regulator, transcriptional pleiotropic regulator of transition state genes